MPGFVCSQKTMVQAAAVRKRLAPPDDTPESVLLNNEAPVKTQWTIRKLYGFEYAALQELLAQWLSARTFSFEHRNTVTKAVAMFASSTADFSHRLIAFRN